MTTKTYAQLGTLASVADGDLIAGYRGAGPLKTYTATIVRTYMSALSLPLTGGTLTGALRTATGNEGAPTVSFSAETGTGIYRSGAGNWDVSISGTRRLNLSATGLNIYGACAATSFAGPLNGAVGGTTPAAGAFTTLSASSTLAASGLSSLTGGYVNGVAVKTANYTLVAADAGKTILFTTNSGLTLTVPASTVPNGAEVKIVNLTGSTLAISGASFLDGLSSPIANLTSCTVISYNDVPMVGR